MNELLERLAAGEDAANEALLELSASGQLEFSQPVTPEVVRLLGDRFVAVPLFLRMGIYVCLRALGKQAAPALPGLVQGLEDPRPECRIQAAELIAGLGSAAAPAVPALIEALADEGREDVREIVAETLARLEADLSALESNPSPYVREGALLASMKRSK